MDTQPVSLFNLNGGALAERFQAALREVLANIADPNCKAEAVRKIKMEVRFKPAEDRSNAATEIDCIAVVAKPKSSSAFVMLSHDGMQQQASVSTAKQLSLSDALEQKRGGANAG